MEHLKNIIYKLKTINNSRKLLIVIFFAIGGISFFLMSKSFLNKNVKLDEVILKNGNNDDGMFAIMLEQGDGKYTESSDNTWPTSGYNFNSEKSGCIDNGGNTVPNVLSYDAVNNKVIVKTNKQVFCYLYFSLPIPDIKVTGIDTTKLATEKYIKSVDCGSAGSATFDAKYQRLEFDSVTAPSECTIKYTEDAKTYPKLNQTIIDMAVEGTHDGTNQAEGDVVHETFDYILSDNSSFIANDILNESNYTITSMETTSDSKNAFIWDSSTSSWISQNHTDSKTNGVSFTVAEGYYQLCYIMSSEKNFDYGIVYLDGVQKFNTKGKDTNKYCEYLGKITSSNVIKVTYRKDSSGSTGDDNIKFYLQNGTYTEDITKETIDTGYRYEGKNPKNYIWFNNELWRIIGVFDTCTELDSSGNCTKTETLTKIIRNESIGTLILSESDDNNWSSTILYKLLNTVDGDSNSGAYLNSTNGTDSGYCYADSKPLKANCDYREIGLGGLNSYYGSMIKNVVWNLGAMSSTTGDENYYNSPASTWYKSERGTIVYSGNDTKTTGYIGLMYGSDYGYSVKASVNCNRDKTLKSYNNAYCASESWLYGQGEEFLINQFFQYNKNNSWVLSSHGDVDDYGTSAGVGVRPVLYLDSTVYVINGEENNVGTRSNPYIIAK